MAWCRGRGYVPSGRGRKARTARLFRATPVPTDHQSEEIAQLLRRTESEPRTHAFARLAELYRKRGDLERALHVVRDGLAHHPHYLAARLVHARVLRELGRTEASTIEFERILAVDAEHPAARAALGRPGSPDRPEVRWGEAARAAAARRWLSGLEEAWLPEGSGNEPSATSPPREPVATSPSRSEPDLDTVTLAALYARQGLFDEAIAVYERMLARDPGNTRLSVALEETRRMAREAAGPRESPGPRPALAIDPVGAATGIAATDAVTIREQLRRILDGESPEGPFMEESRREWLDGLGPLAAGDGTPPQSRGRQAE